MPSPSSKPTSLARFCPPSPTRLILRPLCSATSLTLPEPSPKAISKLVRLKTLRLSWTNLTGPVPASLSNLKNLTFLELNNNQLTGSIPPELAQLTNLRAIRTIDLSRNKLVGDISFMFGKNKSTQSADYSRNMFEFDFSKVKKFPASLVSLDLNHNKVIGSIPASLTKVDDLGALNVSYNRLYGKIPTGGNLQSFDAYLYLHNKCLCSAPLSAYITMATSETNLESGPVNPNVQHSGGTVYATPYVAPAHGSVGLGERLKKFNGKDFKRWQQKMLFYLTTFNLARFLQ
ncbi:hypothetical protein RJ639_016758 [Escallonia herrerae]|uniref:Uncharacterized protein n=1 Tax=Escallonia herrerae TaxID=1293975 RepID=A0AA88VF57_9ASTE|nr:hypothetical protein RJ639_016758 [Escallonia herrerae]